MSNKRALIEETTKNSIDFLNNYKNNWSALDDGSFDLMSNLKKFDNLLESSLLLLKNNNVALLFSGGIDSAVLALKMNQLNLKYRPIIMANEKELDYKNAIEASKVLNLDLTIIPLTMENFEQAIPEIMKIIGTTEEKQINISVPFYFITKYMIDNNLNIAVLGQGADELFCGYQRYVNYMIKDPNTFKKYHAQDLRNSILKNFDRDNAIFSSKGIIVYLPYVNEKIVKLALSLPNEVLINYNAKPPIKKNFLRLYAEMLGLDKKIRQKKKVAIQFGSGSYKLLRRLALKYGFTKPFSQKYGYLRHVQLYLDYLAQENGIRDFHLNLKKERNIRKNQSKN
jgi:asparagine synthase (glutamine-hydrolysing)